MCSVKIILQYELTSNYFRKINENHKNTLQKPPSRIATVQYYEGRLLLYFPRYYIRKSLKTNYNRTNEPKLMDLDGKMLETHKEDMKNVKRKCEINYMNKSDAKSIIFTASYPEGSPMGIITKSGIEFIDNKILKTTMCLNRKAASLAWSIAFAANINAMDLSDHQGTSEYTQQELSHAFNKGVIEIKFLDDVKNNFINKDFFNFMVVRHPLRRILSVFRDQILEENCGITATTYVPKILYHVNQSTNDIYDELHCVSKYPLFSDFLQYVSETDDPTYDHWANQASYCHLCNLDYTAIVKLEHLEDSEFAMKYSGLETHAELKPVHETQTGKTDYKVLKKYYTEIKCALLQKIINYYQMDFDLFNYDYSEFYALCK